MTAEINQKLKFIEGWVNKYRDKHGITPSRGGIPEGSCFAEGEMRNLFRQLVHTKRGCPIEQLKNCKPFLCSGCGDWTSLRDPNVVREISDFLVENIV